jgi:hypothetical protein
MAVASALIGGAAALGSGLLASSGAKKAAKAQTQAAQAAEQTQRQMFERQVELQEPFRQAGMTAQQQIMNLLGIGPRPQAAGAAVNIRENPEAYGLRAINIPAMFGGQAQTLYTDREGNFVRDLDAYAAQNPVMAPGPVDERAAAEYGSLARPFGMQDFQQDPGYAFRQAEGMKALERSAAARGGLMSGATMKGIQRFGQDLASQEYQNAFNRYQIERAARLNPLQSLMGSGQSAANVMTGATGQAASNIGQMQLGAGQARASGYVGQANALAGALGSIGQAALQYPLYQAQMDYLKRGGMTPGGGADGPYGTPPYNPGNFFPSNRPGQFGGFI